MPRPKEESSQTLTIGLFGIGLDTYWPQFSGLKQRLEGYTSDIADKISTIGGVEIVNGGLVDSPERAVAVASLFRRHQVDIIFLYISTYALSSTVLPVVQRVNAPLVVLNIQPVAAIDYEKINALEDRGTMTGEWLAHCQACAVPEVISVFNRTGIAHHLVTGFMQDAETWVEIAEWVQSARVAKAIQNNRLGLIGHYYGGMLDVYTDVTAQLGAFGGHVELLEIDELVEIRKRVESGKIEEKIQEFRSTFDVSPECEQSELERAAATSVALDIFVQKHSLGSIAYFYEGMPGNEQEDIVTSVIAGNTLLTGRNVPVAGEYEIKNAQAMKILDCYGVGGSFSEFYAIDYNDDVVLIGHDGPGHYAIAEGKVALVPLPVYHGKPGKGLSVQMSVRHGPVTLLSVCEGREGVFLLTAEAESVPGPVLNIGNTNSRYRFPIGAKAFISSWSRQGPSHHCAIGTGHVADSICKLGELLSIPVVRIC